MAKCETCGKCRCECSCSIAAVVGASQEATRAVAESTRRSAEKIVAAIWSARPVIRSTIKRGE